MTSTMHNAGRRTGRITGRTGPGGACEVRELKLSARDAIDGGVNFLEIDLTSVDRVETGLIGFLAETLRVTRESHVNLKLRPSLALDRWLDACGLDHCLRPIRAGAA